MTTSNTVAIFKEKFNQKLVKINVKKKKSTSEKNEIVFNFQLQLTLYTHSSQMFWLCSLTTAHVCFNYSKLSVTVHFKKLIHAHLTGA